MINRGKKSQHILITVGAEGFKPNMNKYTGVQFRNIQNALFIIKISLLILKTRKLTSTVIYVMMKRKKINCVFRV